MRVSDVFAAASSIAGASATCPAAGSTDAHGRYSCNPAHHFPNNQTCRKINGCYYLLDSGGRTVKVAVTSSAVRASPATACPALGDYDSKDRYSCNPAHRYPNGQFCNLTDGCYLLVPDGDFVIEMTPWSTTSAAPKQNAHCATAGHYDSKGRYGCDLAHQYPNGQACKIVEDCPLLVGPGGNCIIKATTTASSTATATSKPKPHCVAAGDYDEQGRYACKLAHGYPNGQVCKIIDDCPLLVGSDGKCIIESTGSPTTSRASTSKPNPRPSCAPAGKYDRQGRYACNPAHRYPNGQACRAIDGCHVLVGADGKYITKAATSSTASVTSTATTVSKSHCAAHGTSDNKGRYHCNSAHQYTGGQICSIIEEFHILCDASGKPVISHALSPAPAPTASNGNVAAKPGCSAAGSFDSKGYYYCNPGHLYGGDVTCIIIQQCYILCDVGGKPIVPARTIDGGAPDVPGKAIDGGKPSVSGKPSVPGDPVDAASPKTAGVPAVPGEPVVPGTPATSKPTVPGKPVNAGSPGIPGKPAVGSTPVDTPARPLPTRALTAGAHALEGASVLAVAAFFAIL